LDFDVFSTKARSAQRFGPWLSGVAGDVLSAKQLADVGATPRPINPHVHVLAANQLGMVCFVLTRDAGAT